jgi:2-keto-4-pentenoate hydratase
LRHKANLRQIRGAAKEMKSNVATVAQLGHGLSGEERRMPTPHDIALRIIDAYRTRVALAPVRGEVKGVSAAYEVQQQAVSIWRQRGRRVAGQNIGLTAKAVQEQLGVGEPDFGTLFTDMILNSGAIIERGVVMQPGIEAEIAFVMKQDLAGSKIAPDAVIAATDCVVPAIEICGSRIAAWDIRIEDTIADNASSGLVVVGGVRRKPVLDELAATAMTLRHNDAPAVAGRGSACLGNPAVAVAWLAEALTRFGGKLSAGDLVMSGALARMVPAEPGSRFVAEFSGWDAVTVSFAS